MKQLSKEALQGMTRRELSDYCRSNNIRGFSVVNKAERIELILNSYKSKLTKKIGVKPQFDDINEIEKDYQNLKKKSKEELWRIYGRSHKVYSEDKQMSKGSLIMFILNGRYRKKLLDQWSKPTKKPVKRVKKLTSPKKIQSKKELKTELRIHKRVEEFDFAGYDPDIKQEIINDIIEEEEGRRKTPKRYFEFYGTTSSGGESKKFWEVWQENMVVYVRFGRIGSNGRIMQKDYNSIEQAKKAMNKQIGLKISKGYYEKKTKRSIQPEIRLKTIQTSSTVSETRIKPMLALQNDKYLGNPNYILQQKYDGTRCIIIKKDKISMIGRSWKNDYSPDFPEIVNDIKKIKLNTFVLDSELTFFKGKKDIFLTALAKKESKKGYVAKCMIFDILEYNNKDVKHLPLKKRLELLEKLIPKGLKHLEIVKSYKINHKQIFENIISDKMQGEGVVLKNMESSYTEAARNRDWIKVKGWKSDEAIVVGVTFGAGVRQGSFGSLILAQYHKGGLKHVGNASGFKISEQNELIDKLKPYITKNPQLKISNKKVKYWTKPKLVVEAKFQERTKDGKFRFPSFLRLRYDKTPKECVME